MSLGHLIKSIGKGKIIDQWNKRGIQNEVLYIREHGIQLTGNRKANIEMVLEQWPSWQSACAVLGCALQGSPSSGAMASLAGHSHHQSWRQRETDSGSSLSSWVPSASLPAFLPCRLQAPTSEAKTVAFHRLFTSSYNCILVYRQLPVTNLVTEKVMCVWICICIS